MIWKPRHLYGIQWLAAQEVLAKPEYKGDDLVLGTEKMEKDEESGLWWPVTWPDAIGSWVSYRFTYTSTAAPQRVSVKSDSSEFQLNMVEALVGWRKWKISKDCLQAIFQSANWVPGIQMEARCASGCKHQVPAEFCSCGIYAKNNKEELDSVADGGVIGEVYGWGRYVRGEEGWRAQYAYPKSFYMHHSDMTPEIFEMLRQYHVPIYVEQPSLFYNPQEDGYEYRNDQENGNCGASEVSGAGDGADQDLDEEDSAGN